MQSANNYDNYILITYSLLVVEVETSMLGVQISTDCTFVPAVGLVLLRKIADLPTQECISDHNLSPKVGWPTGCLAISVKSETPLFLDIYRRSRLFFHVVIGHCAGFDFLKKKCANFFLVRVRARYKPSLVFRLNLVCSKFKFKSSASIQLFGLKTTSHVKYDLKNSFLR